jgi:hypothetical protein
MSIVFLTFGNEAFSAARERIRYEARASRFFNEVVVLDESNLSPQLRAFCEANKHVDRGYGCYLWKPALVSQIASLEQYRSSIIFYIDSGSWINRFGFSRLQEYLAMISDEKPFLVFERRDYVESQSSKRDVFEVLNAHEYADKHPIMAGIFGFKVSDLSRSIVNQWRDICFSHLSLLDQTKSLSGPEYANYEANRNDQGIFSLILKKNNCFNSVSAEEILPELHPSYLDMSRSPFIAMRDRNGLP